MTARIEAKPRRSAPDHGHGREDLRAPHAPGASRERPRDLAGRAAGDRPVPEPAGATRCEGPPIRRTVAVIVTMSRPRELDALLRSIERQRPRPDAVIVVDNMPGHETAEVVARDPAIRHLVSRRNLGGAGGFSYGILAALADGATHVWLMDDDGLPLEPECLGALLAAADAHGADVVSPVIVDIEDPSRLAFPYFVGRKRMHTRGEIAEARLVRQFAHLFNGALVRAESFARFGIPDYRLFLRGDEIDFLNRVLRGGGHVLTVTDVAFRHPSSACEAVPVLGGLLHAVVPPDPGKQFHFFRNRGYLLRRHRLYAQALHDVLRYGWYFLVARRGDWRGFGGWCRLLALGAREEFRPYRPPPEDEGMEPAPGGPRARPCAAPHPGGAPPGPADA
jgi:rhamnopyranosyl-N-acetylglucosaminyl-diphospho-decaprenol beta-1,3/1,4-galactofuranosyltransferase